jgi:tetratricopeptide (TPR) repeat protein
MLCVVYALLIIVSLGVIVRRNTVWRDDMTLYTRTLQTNPDAAVIRSNLGALYFDTRQYDRALKEWQLALQQKPDNRMPWEFCIRGWAGRRKLTRCSSKR